MNANNKAEMDCLLCHLDQGMNPDGNGLALYQTWMCGMDITGDGLPDMQTLIGPAVDRNCNGVEGESIVTTDGGTVVEANMGGMAMTALPLPAVTAYDMYNRNFGLKNYRLVELA